MKYGSVNILRDFVYYAHSFRSVRREVIDARQDHFAGLEAGRRVRSRPAGAIHRRTHNTSYGIYL